MFSIRKARMSIKKEAFTLLELAIVLLVIGLIGGMGLLASKDAIDSANKVATQNRLNVIEKALFSFWQKNSRLPCPGDATLATTDSNYGLEASMADLDTCIGGAIDSNFTTSSTYKHKAAEGSVPVNTLGIPVDFMYDGWGRKIAYAVVPILTSSKYAREQFPVKYSNSCPDNMAIRIKDASGAYRSNNAVYALVSYGKNGHGGYHANGGSRFNSGATNVDELANCHCTNAAVDSTYVGDYVQRTSNFNSVNAASYFDDIVRYKERWQFVTTQDVMNDDGYRGPDLALAYVKSGSGTVYLYKNQCRAFVKQADLSPLPTNEVRGLAFTANNKHLLVYSALGCNLYKINPSGSLTDLPSAFTTACPYDSTAVMALSNNGYLAISDSDTSAVIRLWKRSDDKFLALPDLTHSAASVAELSFSPNAKLLAVRSATTTSKVYKRKGDSFSAAAVDITQPANLSVRNTPLSLVFSPDGRYLADIELDGGDSGYYLGQWRVLGGSTPSFAQLTSFALFETQQFDTLAFSPDSKYFTATGIYELKCYIDPNDEFCGGTTTANSWLTGVYRDTLSSSFAAGNGKSHIAYSRDSNFHIVSRAGDTALPNVVKRFNAREFNSNSIFNDNGSDGGAFVSDSTPDLAFDYILYGSTGGPVAFAH